MRNAARRSQASQVSFPAPVQGIIENVPTSLKKPTQAEWIENFLPTVRGLRVRGGTQEHAVVASGVQTLFTYISGVSQRLFASTATAFYEVTSSATQGTAVVSGLTSGKWSTQQLGTSGGEFLVAVNGADTGQIFDGSAWANISITGVASTSLSHVWSHQSRLFFVQSGSLKAWYLPVASIGGAALDINLAGVFQRGGELLFGATWSLDTGDGMDDKCVFVTTQGEVAIYSGSDPSSAASWALEGRYDIGRPLSSRAHTRIGGDLLISTDDGIVPLSAVFTKDPADLSLAAVSRPIKATWSLEAARAGDCTQLVKWTTGEALLVVLPAATRMLTANLQTGAWAVQTGWAGACGAELAGEVYIGEDTGSIKRINTSGTDDGSPFVAKVCGAFGDFGDPISYKAASLMRAAYYADSAFNAQYSVSTDYSIEFPSAPAVAGINTTAMIWGTSNWGEAQWVIEIEEPSTGVTDHWASVAGTGQEFAPVVQITSGGTERLPVELVRIDLMVEQGGRVV